MTGYSTIAEMVNEWGIIERRIKYTLLARSSEGAVKFGNTWAIPNDTEKPRDEQIKSGRYIKKKKESDK